MHLDLLRQGGPVRQRYQLETWDPERGVWVAVGETVANRDRAVVACNARRRGFLSAPVRAIVVGTGEVVTSQIGYTDAQRDRAAEEKGEK